MYSKDKVPSNTTVVISVVNLTELPEKWASGYVFGDYLDYNNNNKSIEIACMIIPWQRTLCHIKGESKLHWHAHIP